MTEYDLPRKTIEPHDVIVDADGIVWFSNFGEQFLGRLDPKTAKVTEYPVPLTRPGFPTGMLDLETDTKGDLWLSMMYQNAWRGSTNRPRRSRPGACRRVDERRDAAIDGRARPALRCPSVQARGRRASWPERLPSTCQCSRRADHRLLRLVVHQLWRHAPVLNVWVCLSNRAMPFWYIIDSHRSPFVSVSRSSIPVEKPGLVSGTGYSVTFAVLDPAGPELFAEIREPHQCRRVDDDVMRLDGFLADRTQS